MGRKTLNNAPVRHSQRWTQAEDRQLVTMVKDGLSTSQIAKTLDRTPHSIACHKHDLGIVRRIKNGKREAVQVKQPVAKQVETKAPVAKQKAVVAKAPAKAVVESAATDMITTITNVVSKVTKQYGIKATVIVFEN